MITLTARKIDRQGRVSRVKVIRCQHDKETACCASPLKLSSSNCSVSSAADVMSPFVAVIGLLAMLEDWRIADEGFPCQQIQTDYFPVTFILLR